MQGFSGGCNSCGGQLKQIDRNTYECVSCKSRYHVEGNDRRRISVNLSVKTLVSLMAGVMMIAVLAGIVFYAGYTGKLMGDAARFSVAYRDFLLEAYDKPVAEISAEDLEQLKYLRIERDGDYLFTYSFEDYYAYSDVKEFEKTLKTIAVDAVYKDYSALDVRFFTGLTRLEIYTGAWQNYMLPEENNIRCILCNNGTSQYGESTFFERVNSETLEEVRVFEKEELKELYFLQDITGVRRLTLERAVLTDADVFGEFDRLEELYLRFPIVEEERAYEIVEGILQCSELKLFYVEGKLAYYLTEEEWKGLEDTYGDRVEILRQ
ncbi:MAG: hypothetical protein IJ379_13525 [Lachnospiraceae bacterium]|nr:hypothetical protein [Lachnospiraceae bacterium]